MPVPAPAPAAPAASDRVLTLPNAFTTVRLCLIPVFVVLVAMPHRRDWFAAAVLLGALGSTDWVDGFLARRLGQVSTVGKVLDPLADRLLLITAAVTIVVVGAVPLVVAVLGLAREGVVAAGFLLVAALGGRRMDVARLGKVATLGMMVALPCFLAGHSTIGAHVVFEVLAWVTVIPALVVGWVAAARYVPGARRAVAEARRSQSGQP